MLRKQELKCKSGVLSEGSKQGRWRGSDETQVLDRGIHYAYFGNDQLLMLLLCLNYQCIVFVCASGFCHAIFTHVYIYFNHLYTPISLVPFGSPRSSFLPNRLLPTSMFSFPDLNMIESMQFLSSPLR